MSIRCRGGRLVRVLLAAACVAAAGCSASPPAGPGPARPVGETAPASRLTAFESEAELLSFVRNRARAPRARFMGFSESVSGPAAAYVAGAATSVTNVQHAGVDEGDIVKVHGEHLVVLRRGRLFTVRLDADRLTPISTIDAFAPDIDPGRAWYDELLISGDTVVVLGYSYARGGTELVLFDIDARGTLAYRATYHLRSQDYYSSRNYASRLIGQRLIVYTPLMLDGDGDPRNVLPAIRKWHPGAGRSEFVPIYSPRRLYRPLSVSPLLALHSVVSCDLAQPELTCEVTGVMGPPGRVFYVSPSAVYVWMTDDWWSTSDGPSWLYRLPLDGGEPGAARVWGSPVDQFSFLEDAGHVNVVVRAEGAGEGMWRSDRARGILALLRLPLSSFGDGRDAVPFWRYRMLPAPAETVFQNRFVGAHLLYGSGDGWGQPAGSSAAALYVHAYARDSEPVAIAVGHAVERIEALGEDALVVGAAARDLHVSSIRLERQPAVVGRYVVPGAAQGEWRSHGFFYRPERRGAGIVGLPVRARLASGAPPAAVLFLRNDALALGEMGSLHAERRGTTGDACRVSCVDWYGNARPLFLRGRIFALLGYELVEGALAGGRLEERRRVDFAPAAAAQ